MVKQYFHILLLTAEAVLTLLKRNFAVGAKLTKAYAFTHSTYGVFQTGEKRSN